MPMSSWEFDEINVDLRIKFYEPIFNKLKWEIIDSEEWVLRYLAENKLDVPDELIESLKVSSTYSGENPPALRPLRADARSFEEKQAYEKSKSDWFEGRATELENSIQVLREWIIKNFNPNQASKPLHLAFEREKSQHLSHQKEISARKR